MQKIFYMQYSRPSILSAPGTKQPGATIPAPPHCHHCGITGSCICFVLIKNCDKACRNPKCHHPAQWLEVYLGDKCDLDDDLNNNSLILLADNIKALNQHRRREQQPPKTIEVEMIVATKEH